MSLLMDLKYFFFVLLMSTVFWRNSWWNCQCSQPLKTKVREFKCFEKGFVEPCHEFVKDLTHFNLSPFFICLCDPRWCWMWINVCTARYVYNLIKLANEFRGLSRTVYHLANALFNIWGTMLTFQINIKLTFLFHFHDFSTFGVQVSYVF